MDGSSLTIGIFTGAIGMAYFVYGKKTSKLWFVSSGILLIAYPYFVNNLIALLAIGIILLVCPFIA